MPPHRRAATRPPRKPAGPDRRFHLPPRGWGLVAILGLALAVRLWGIGDRLPDASLGADPMLDTSVDEGDRRAMLYAWEMWRGGTARLDLNPRTGDWPGLPFYLTLGEQWLYRGYRAVVHGGESAAAFAERVQADRAPMYRFARCFGVLLGLGTIALTFRLGLALAGPAAGLAAALLLALNPDHVLASQRISDPNMLVLLFSLAATLAMIDDRAYGSAPRSALAGALIGLAGASKYAPLSLVAVFAFSQTRWSWAGRARSGAAVRWACVAAGVVACGAAFFLASPFTLLDWTAKHADVALQRGRLLGHWVGQSEFPIALPTYLVRTFAEMLGWPVYAAGIVGSERLWRRGRSGRLAVLVLLGLFVPFGFLAVAQQRFVLPCAALFAIAAAVAILRGAERLEGRTVPRTAARTLAAVALGVCVVWTLPGLVSARQTLGRPDSRHAARRWIEATVPRSEPMAVDLYGPVFTLGPNDRLAVLWPFLATQEPLVRAAYHPEWLDGIRYYVTSKEVEGRFDAEPERFPVESAFYRWIREHGERVWRSDPGELSGPEIEVLRLPGSVGTREERDRLWTRARTDSMYGERMGRWCSDMAHLFLWREEHERAAEWALRGLTLDVPEVRTPLRETLALAQLRLDRPDDAEATARAGLAASPRSPLLHLYRAMALEALSRRDEALAEFETTLPLCPTPESATFVRAQIARLRGGGTR